MRDERNERSVRRTAGREADHRVSLTTDEPSICEERGEMEEKERKREE